MNYALQNPLLYAAAVTLKTLTEINDCCVDMMSLRLHSR